MITQRMIRTVRQFMFMGTAMAAVALCALPTNAATPAGPAITVKYADLDLSTTTGVQRLYNRIVAAAEQVCPTIGSKDLHAIMSGRTCRAEAIARAVRAVNSQGLAAIHEQHAQHG